VSGINPSVTGLRATPRVPERGAKEANVVVAAPSKVQDSSYLPASIPFLQIGKTATVALVANSIVLAQARLSLQPTYLGFPSTCHTSKPHAMGTTVKC